MQFCLEVLEAGRLPQLHGGAGDTIFADVKRCHRKLRPETPLKESRACSVEDDTEDDEGRWDEGQDISDAEDSSEEEESNSAESNEDSEIDDDDD